MHFVILALVLTFPSYGFSYRVDEQSRRSRNVEDARHTCPNFHQVRAYSRKIVHIGINENPVPSLPPKITKGILEIQREYYVDAVEMWKKREQKLDRMLMSGCSYPGIAKEILDAGSVIEKKKSSYKDMIQSYDATISGFGG